MNKKNLYIIAGFLGSGKTTFLNEIVKYFENRKFALIINEFGSIDVDGSLFENLKQKVSKISDGSILCSCKSDKFVETMIDISKQEYSDVIVETSGVSDMTVLGKILDTVSRFANNAFALKAVITVADCTRICKMAAVSRPVKGQLIYADYIVLNKTDMCSKEEVDQAIDFIKQLNPESPIQVTSFGKIEKPDLLNIKRSIKFKPNVEDVTSPWLDKFTILFKNVVDYKTLRSFIKDMENNVLRMKGFVDTNSGTYYIDYVSGNNNFTLTYKREQSFLTVIYEHTTPLKLVVEKKLKLHFSEGASIE